MGSRLPAHGAATAPPGEAAVSAAAQALVAHRFLLPEDLGRAIAQALREHHA